MTLAITRARVCEALSKAECFVPDFTTRKKTALTWNKVYISIQSDELRFIELNFFQRIIRYIAGCIWYADTIFRDKDALEKVKGYVRSLKDELRDPIAMNLLSKAQTTTDFNCLWYMLRNCSEQNDFSEEFLSEAISLAKQNPKMGMNITKAFDASINKALLHEIFGHAEDSLPILQIEVPYQIKYAFEEGIEKANNTLKSIGSPQTLVGYLKALGTLEKINKELDNLPEVLRPFLTVESGQKMVQDLSDWLVVKKVHASISKAYLEDEQQIVNRLCYHAGLESTALRTQIKERENEYRAAAMKELDAHYDVVKCNRYQKSTKETSREQQLTMLSKSTGRPVVIVQLQYKMSAGLCFKWIDGINLDFDEKPIILNIEKEIWNPVEERV